MTGTVAAIVVAAGRGERAGGGVAKQYRHIAGEPMILPTLRAFSIHSRIQTVQPVIGPADEEHYRAATAGLPKSQSPAIGGTTRQASVRAGLEALAPIAPDLVLIHDAARPFLTGALIDRAIDAGRAA